VKNYLVLLSPNQSQVGFNDEWDNPAAGTARQSKPLLCEKNSITEELHKFQARKQFI
jgi:hypothetical protein